MNGRIDRQGKRFLLSNDGMSYAFEVTETDVPVNLYWGVPLDSIGDLPSPELRQSNRHTPADLTGRKFRELPVFGGKFFDESALKISYSDGIRGSEFRFSGEEREGEFADPDVPRKPPCRCVEIALYALRPYLGTFVDVVERKYGAG